MLHGTGAWSLCQHEAFGSSPSGVNRQPIDFFCEFKSATVTSVRLVGALVNRGSSMSSHLKHLWSSGYDVSLTR